MDNSFLNSSMLARSQGLDQASLYHDLNSLDSIRKAGLSDQKGAIQKAAKEFEAFFLKMMLSAMRKAGEVIGEDNMLKSHQEKMYTQMFDEQLAVDLASRNSLGIADLLAAQLIQNQQGLNDSHKQTITDYQSMPIVQSGIKKSENNDFGRKLKLESDSPIGLRVQNQEQASVKSPYLDSLSTTKKSAEQEVLQEKVVPTKRSLFDSAKSFVSELYPYAKAAAEKIGLDPKVLLAQAALETGWGQFIMHDEQGQPGFNLFGIKSSRSWQGPSIEIDTLEVKNAIVNKEKAKFRKYDSFMASFQDYVSFISQNQRYQDAMNVSEKPEAFIQSLQRSGYATDPEYANKIMRIFSDEAIQKIDSGEQ